MALLFIDGFDHYATADLTKKWTAINGSPLISASAGRRGGGALAWGATGAHFITKTITTGASFVVGFAYSTSYIGSNYTRNIVWLTDAGTAQVGVRINGDGTLSVMRGLSTGTVLATTTNTLVTGNIAYIEFKTTINSTTGSFDLRVNGVSWVSGSSANTRSTTNNSANQVSIGCDGTTFLTPTLVFDDFYICDTSGSTNNNFLGDCRIDTLYPSSDGNYTGFAPSTGTSHFAVVDETAPNTTDYVSAGVSGTKDSYGFTNLTGAATVYGVQVCNAALKDNAGSCSVSNLVRSGTTDATSTAVALSTSQLYYLSIHETDPATSAAWTQTAVNAAEFGTVVG